MRRRWLAALVAPVLLLATTGCTRHPGGDGDISDDWAPMAAPTVFVPAAGLCHPDNRPAGGLREYNPVDCTRRHAGQTFHVGTLTGDLAAGGTPPQRPAELASVHRRCDEPAADFLGAPWRSGRLRLDVVLPTAEAWAGGARWFRCDLSETYGLLSDGASWRTGSLANALAGPAPDLRFTCAQVKVANNRAVDTTPRRCDQEHNLEFAGAWLSPERSYAEFVADKSTRDRGCLAVAARHVRAAPTTVSQHLGWFAFWPREQDWAAGDRGTRCFLWSDKRPVRRSLQAVGPQGLTGAT